MGSGRMRSKFRMVLSSWRHALKSTNHSAKVCLRTAVNLEKTNAQAPNGKKLVVTAVSQWAVYECKSVMQQCSKKGKPGFWTYSWAWNSQRLEWNLSTLLVTDGLPYLIKGSTIDLLRKVQGIKIFTICKHSKWFWKDMAIYLLIKKSQEKCHQVFLHVRAIFTHRSTEAGQESSFMSGKKTQG